jgi:hypothetical protein
MGSAEAVLIDPWIMYNTYIIARRGTANTDNAYLSVQLGIRDPSFCYTAWCVYGVDQRYVRGNAFPGFPWWIPVPNSNVPWQKTIW